MNENKLSYEDVTDLLSELSNTLKYIKNIERITNIKTIEEFDEVLAFEIEKNKRQTKKNVIFLKEIILI